MGHGTQPLPRSGQFQPAMTFVETSGMLTPATSAWQKQEVLKGIDLLVGTLDGGWGFHCWQEMVSSSPPTFQTKRYTAEEANAMVQNGSIVTHPVFDRGESAMFSAIISDSDISHILAYNIPAVSSATGRMPVIKGKSETFNLARASFQRNAGLFAIAREGCLSGLQRGS